MPSTPESVKAFAQTDEAPASDPSGPKGTDACPGEGTAFVIGASVPRAAEGQWKDREGDQPIYRPLKIFALDPSISRLEGATAVVNVPYERLEAGPVGSLFWVSGATAGDQQSTRPYTWKTRTS